MVRNHGWGIHLFVDGSRGYDLSDNFIHDNLISLRDDTINGLSTSNAADPVAYSTSKGNRFRHNVYVVPRRAVPRWFWAERFMTWRQWRAAGQDRTGLIRRI